MNNDTHNKDKNNNKIIVIKSNDTDNGDKAIIQN